MRSIEQLTTLELERLSGMWLVKSSETKWKANKLKVRLAKRLKREGKRHLSLEPTRKLLADSLIVLEALKPIGASEALDLVKAQIANCQKKIDDVMYRYRLLFPDEIALKRMNIELLEMRAEMERQAKLKVDALLDERAQASQPADQDSQIPLFSEAIVLNARTRFAGAMQQGDQGFVIAHQNPQSLRAMMHGFFKRAARRLYQTYHFSISSLRIDTLSRPLNSV